MLRQSLPDVGCYVLIIFFLNADYQSFFRSQNGIMPTRKAYLETSSGRRQPLNKLLEVCYQLYSNVLTTFVERIHVYLYGKISGSTENPSFQEFS